MKCQLCGFEFDERAMDCHGQCPLREGCAIICCPNCGYQVVDTERSRLAGLVRRLQNTLSEGRKERKEP